MTLEGVPLRIAQLSDIHCGTPTFEPGLMEGVIERVNRMRPDVVVVVGDLTADGYEGEYEDAARWIGRFTAPAVVVPGNHDARNLGHLHFQRIFGERFRCYRESFEDERAERMRATGVTIVAVDSSEPDLNDGRIGREWYGWITEQYRYPDDIKVFAVHHHLVSVPGTGRERNTVVDAGDLLDVLAGLDLDIVLSGHKHVPFFWGLNGILICNSGTPCTRRLRGLTPPSWNEITVDAATIKVHLHYEDGRRELAVVRTRADRFAIRDSFHVTAEFRAATHVVAT
ncbi:MAG TPA: metallophosphoesterase [Nitriliruptorales bacterium]|nr:metallophosphoesterase [Nitriliruptorales bacterium]